MLYSNSNKICIYTCLQEFIRVYFHRYVYIRMSFLLITALPNLKAISRSPFCLQECDQLLQYMKSKPMDMYYISGKNESYRVTPHTASIPVVYIHIYMYYIWREYLSCIETYIFSACLLYRVGCEGVKIRLKNFLTQHDDVSSFKYWNEKEESNALYTITNKILKKYFLIKKHLQIPKPGSHDQSNWTNI